MKFSIVQRVAVPPDAAISAYGNPAFYEGRAPGGDISLVGVVGHEAGDAVARIDVRYAFTGSVSSAVRAIVDPAKMSWVTRTEIHRDQRRANFTVLPDHYPDRLQCEGTFRFGVDATDEEATVITIEGDLKVHVFLVTRSVEQLIVNGLRTYLEAEMATLPDFTARD